MNSGLTEIAEEIRTKSKKSLQISSSKAQIHAKFHKIPTIHFKDQKLAFFFRIIDIPSAFETHKH